ncbi:MAG: histidine--tRNA ligase [Firmicutes bacterium]|nr:histidine--tRNA ligase [Bacillota bacterium]HXL04206.1 histidine--tRNA ligase [Bacillota bacterium]
MTHIRAPRGTIDVFPEKPGVWQRLEETVRSVCRNAGYTEIRTPIFEHTELFQRGVGESTDIVEKEMYTFLDKGERSITLRPEGTAPVVRAYLEHKMWALPQPVKVYYIGPMFRYERPQMGRLRQHTQFGVEALGASSPALDAEVISVLISVYQRLGLEGFVVRLNSIGCSKCRPRYKESLMNLLSKHTDELCADCRRRLERNPLRVLDCKNERCAGLAKKLPPIFDYLCEDCSRHFEGVTECLTALDLIYELDPTIVRGLDYYTKTVFEVIHSGLGAQDALGGGGRYDGLAEELGGSAIPGVGFAAGIERAVQVLQDAEGGAIGQEAGRVNVFIAAMGDEAKLQALRLARLLREQGTSADIDYLDRSLRAQMKYADKQGVKKVVIIGEDELKGDYAVVRDMATGDQAQVQFRDLVQVLT